MRFPVKNCSKKSDSLIFSLDFSSDIYCYCYYLFNIYLSIYLFLYCIREYTYLTIYGNLPNLVARILADLL